MGLCPLVFICYSTHNVLFNLSFLVYKYVMDYRSTLQVFYLRLVVFGELMWVMRHEHSSCCVCNNLHMNFEFSSFFGHGGQ